jgi:hypothetical protein
VKSAARFKRTAIPSAGYDYQYLVGVDVLIRHYRDPDLYEWVALEADEYHALDDVVAARKDGSLELVQVKFTVDAERYELDWSWLLDKATQGTSLLAKWSTTLARIAEMGPIHSAGLKTNRRPSELFAKCLKGTRVDFDLIPEGLRGSVEAECGGPANARAFFRRFEFLCGTPDLTELERSLRDQLVPSDTDMLGWHVLRSNVRRWATFKNQPEPDGRIRRDHVLQIITKKRPHSMRQDFLVPHGYAPPSARFDKAFWQRITGDASPITILWGTPGRGKSTYLSFLTQQLEKEGAGIARHHYFLASEDSSSNRTSFVEISTSIVEQLFAHHPEVMQGLSENFNELRATMATAAGRLADAGKHLYIIVDGLDHVWRDTGDVQQLDRLFNELLPLPPNVCLIVGTQRVADQQLPRKLLTIAKDADWIEIPPMDEMAVHRWVMQQDEARPLILRFDPTSERRAEMMDEIAAAFFRISRGHPLHLIYAYESVIHAGAPTSAEEIDRLPPCPAGDIRDYYQGLWVRLGAGAKNALHMLAGSDFFWPGFGVRAVLGDYSEVEFLLEPRNVGLVPFHPSIFAWVRERRDHAESYKGLLPKIIDWLGNHAPEYWRWGWLWLARAQAGEYTDLLTGATRDWVAESLVKGWPDRQIENILAAAERKTFDAADYPRTVAIRSLKTRVSNARQFQSRDFAAYRATALAISNNHQQTLNLLDEIQILANNEIFELARKGPDEVAAQTIPVCFEELARRVNAWIILRHRPAGEFTKLSDQLLSLGALKNVETVRRILAYARGFRHPKPHVSRLISLLGDAQNIEGLQFVRKTLSGAKWAEQRRLIDDALIRIGSFQGADVMTLVRPGKQPISLYAACWFLWRDRTARHAAYTPPIPSGLIRKRYLSTEYNDLEAFYIDSFWGALRRGLMAGGDASETHHVHLDGDDPGWLIVGLHKLLEIARDLACERLAPSFSAVFTASNDIAPLRWVLVPERHHAHYRAFRDALLKIALDLHMLVLSDQPQTQIAATELATARKSVHWIDEMWVSRNVEHRICFLDDEGAAAILDDEARRLVTTVTDFSERGERWAMLADMARLYANDRAAEFLKHAAECLVGYGHRKDLYAMEVLSAVADVAEHDVAATRTRLETVAPIIDVITDFTDGDETDYVRSEFIKVVAKLAPERLPSIYGHHLSIDEYSYADECLIELIEVVDLEASEVAALTRTLLDERTLGVLEQRAKEDSAARALLARQNAFLGRQPKPEEVKSVEALSDRDEEGEKVDPRSFGAGEFPKLAAAASSVELGTRGGYMGSWLNHWKDHGRAKEALSSIRRYFEAGDVAYGADEILDQAFLVSLAVEGKAAAYSWLVSAHIHRHGWETYWTSEGETIRRLQLAARYYRDRWQDYIRDTSDPAPFYRRRGADFVIGYKYLVRFLMLVGQSQMADRIAASFVETLVDEVREQPIPEAAWFH